MESPLPDDQTVKLLEDEDVYLGNQVECPGRGRCYGIETDDSRILLCEYGCNGATPEILLYKKRR